MVFKPKPTKQKVKAGYKTLYIADSLTEKLNKFGNISMALMAYNAGDSGANKHWFSKGIYTNKYSQKVMNYAATLERNVEL